MLRKILGWIKKEWQPYNNEFGFAVVTHSGTLPDDSAKTDFYSIIDGATVTGIVNADCSASMGLVDTKLAQITTASKVAGTALTGLTSIPVGAGVIPSANVGMPVSGSMQVTAATDITGAGSEADMTDMTTGTFSTVGTKLLCIFSAPFWSTNSNQSISLDVYINVDGSNVRHRHGQFNTSGYGNSCYEIAFQHLATGLTPGNHIVKIRWNSAATTYQYGSTQSERILTVIDMG